MYGVVIMVIFGIVGYLFNKAHIPLAPMLLSFVLAPIFESNLRKAFIMSQGSVSIFFQSTLSCVFLGITLLLILAPTIKKIVRKVKASKTQA